MPVHQGPGYVRVVGRQLFPHAYHKVDKIKLFSASWRASRALAMVRLPSNYPYQMPVGSSAGRPGCTHPHTTPCELPMKQRPPFYARSVVGTLPLHPSSFNPLPPDGWVLSRRL